MDQLNRQIDRELGMGDRDIETMYVGARTPLANANARHTIAAAVRMPRVQSVSGYRTAVAAWLSLSPEDPHPHTSMATLCFC